MSFFHKCTLFFFGKKDVFWFVMQMQPKRIFGFQVGCIYFFVYLLKKPFRTFCVIIIYHIIMTQRFQNSSCIFSCGVCDYNTSRASQYDRHCLTRKHQIMTNNDSLVPSSEKKYTCGCGTQYRFRQGLFAHKKTCYGFADSTVQSRSDQPKHPLPDTRMILELIQQNQEFKSMLIEQQKDNQLLQQQLIDAVKDGKTVHNTNNNQKFNLNFFLNTTCKDAVNLSDFIQTIEVQMQELESIGHNGYVAGMTDIILSRIKDLDVSKRPVHCTDLKREIMYIKDQNEWNKDTTEKSYLRKAISMVSKLNYGKTMEWRERNPECLEIGSPKYDFCFKMMRNVLGDFEDIQIKLDNKIIKNLAKEVLVDR
jgi:hypothetical protein